MQKSNYRKSLEKMFTNQAPITKSVKLSDVFKEPELMSYTPTEWTKAQRETEKLEKAENALIDGYEMLTNDNQKIKVKVPKRLRTLVE